MTEQILVIDYEQCEERIENSLDEFFKTLEKEQTLDDWVRAIHDQQVKIFKIEDGKFKEVKVRPKVTYIISEEE